jgi:hypothetical protein
VVVRGIVAGLSGPVLAPFYLMCEGRTIGAAPVSSVMERVTAAVSRVLSLAPRERTIHELLRENLYDADLTDEERARLAAHAQQVAQQQRARAARDVEAIQRMGGAWFPDDPTPRSDWDDVIDDIHAKFQRWR